MSHSMPPGCRFKPTDLELIEEFLKRKVMEGTCPYNPIMDFDVYGIEPWLLPGIYTLIPPSLYLFFYSLYIAN